MSTTEKSPDTKSVEERETDESVQYMLVPAEEVTGSREGKDGKRGKSSIKSDTLLPRHYCVVFDRTSSTQGLSEGWLQGSC